MSVGKVLRSHAGGYLVHLENLGVTFQCAARGRLKKEGTSILTGDLVELAEIDPIRKTAVIATRLARESLLSRPPLANVDQVIIVQSLYEPAWNPILCDRYLVHFQLELPLAAPILCVNKCDIASLEELTTLQKIYEPLGYSVIFVSAKTGQGMDALITQLKGKVSVLAGPSGVGKSSLINYLQPGLKLKVGVVDEDVQLGKHTTTASELYQIPISANTFALVADTPGFNLSELKHPEPTAVFFQFPELAKFYAECKYSNCLHLVEQGCNVLANLAKIPQSRYQSYTTLVVEAQAENKLRKTTSQKIESTVKIKNKGKGQSSIIPKLTRRYRLKSRRLSKQNLLEIDDYSQVKDQPVDDN